MPRNSDVFMLKFSALIAQIYEEAQPEFSFIAVAKPDIELNSDDELQREELRGDYDFTRTPHGLASDVFKIVSVTN